MKEINNIQYFFSKDLFDQNSRQNWDRIVPIINPKKILEIGSYEGAAACYLGLKYLWYLYLKSMDMYYPMKTWWTIC